MYRLLFLVLFLLAIGILLTGCNDKQSNARRNSSNELSDHLLLKDWMPESIHKAGNTDVQQAKYPVIDMHAHAYAKTEEELDKRVGIMDSVGIEKSLVLTKATGAEFKSVYALHSMYPDRFEVYCGIDYSGYDEDGWSPKAVEQLRRDAEAGCKGIGELHDKGAGMGGAPGPGMHPDDPRMDPIFEEAAKLNLPVNLHVAEPIWMYGPMDATNDGLMRAYTWQVQNQDEIVGHDGMIEILDKTLARHPNTTFVAAHLANTSNDFSLLANLFDKHSNLYADVSARFAEFSTIPRTAAAFFEKYQDRIVYGTDYGFETFPDDPDKPYGKNTTTQEMFRMTFRVLETEDEHFYMTDLVGYRWPMYGLALSDQTLKKIYRDNAQKILM
jgi:predicted TIM-barrel fold metal-dependent hydrolase